MFTRSRCFRKHRPHRHRRARRMRGKQLEQGWPGLHAAPSEGKLRRARDRQDMSRRPGSVACQSVQPVRSPKVSLVQNAGEN